MEDSLFSSVLLLPTTLVGISIPQQVFVYSILFHAFLYIIGSSLLSKILFSSIYNKLNKTDKFEWDSRTISTIHALLISISGTLIYFSHPKFYLEWDLYHHDTLYESLFYFSTGYMLVDLVYVILYFPQIGGVDMIIHHLFIMTAEIVTAENQLIEILGVTVCFTEYTTFFINMRWFLVTANLKESNLYIINGLLLWLVWAITRIGFAIYCLLFFIYKFNDWMILIEKIGNLKGYFLFCFYLIQSLNLAILNVMWFYKLTMGVYKVLFAKKDVEKKEQ
ncbi:hypothetical protein ABK040_000566 [Willaertia magna]